MVSLGFYVHLLTIISLTLPPITLPPHLLYFAPRYLVLKNDITPINNTCTVQYTLFLVHDSVHKRTPIGINTFIPILNHTTLTNI